MPKPSQIFLTVEVVVLLFRPLTMLFSVDCVIPQTVESLLMVKPRSSQRSRIRWMIAFFNVMATPLLPIRVAILQQILDFAVQDIADLCNKIQINSFNMILIIPVDDLIFDSSEGF